MCYNQDLIIYAQRSSDNHGIKSTQYTQWSSWSQTAIAFSIKEICIVPLWANTMSKATSFVASVHLRHRDCLKFIPYDAWIKLHVSPWKHNAIKWGKWSFLLILHATCHVNASIDLLQHSSVYYSHGWLPLWCGLCCISYLVHFYLGTYHSLVKEHSPSKEHPPPTFLVQFPV